MRILCATHKDLGKAVAAGEFRQDLYYRLNVIEMRLPALRERREDLDALVRTLMDRICQESGQQPAQLSGAAAACAFPSFPRTPPSCAAICAWRK